MFCCLIAASLGSYVRKIMGTKHITALAGVAASVGPVDQQQMYYLMSRGIPRAQAERMVIRGFLGAVLSAIPAADVRNKLITILERKLADGQQYE